MLSQDRRWQDSFDGIETIVARKTGPLEAEILGLCVLIEDQTWTPIHARIAISASTDEISWLDCKVGDRGDGQGGMRRIPYDESRVMKDLYLVSQRASDITWVFSVRVGSRTAL